MYWCLILKIILNSSLDEQTHWFLPVWVLVWGFKATDGAARTAWRSAVKQTKSAVDSWSSWFLRDPLTKQPLECDGVNVCFWRLARKRWEEWGLFSLPFLPTPFTHPETQRLRSLDWSPDGEFIKCNKWRQNASSCPRRLGTGRTYSGRGVYMVFSSRPLWAAETFSLLQYHLSSAAHRRTWSCQISNCTRIHLNDYLLESLPLKNINKQ